MNNETPTHVLWWDFFNPGRLWALLAVVVLLVGYIILLRLKKHRGMRYTQTGIVGAVLPRQSQWRRHVAVAATLASLVAITGAWARPSGEVQEPRERATVVMVLDHSLSMQAKDVSPDRLTASRDAALRFIDGLPPQYNVAVVGLSGQPSIMVLPGIDRGATRLAIQKLDLDDGTAIGDAIMKAIEAVESAPGDEGIAPGIIVMLSDGGDNMSEVDPTAAAQQAKEKKIPIYTIAFGTMNGYVDLDGRRENVAPDIDLLREIGRISGGEMVDAKSAAQLDRVYEKMQTQVTYETVHKEVTARWAMYALAFALVATLGAVSMAARWP